MTSDGSEKNDTKKQDILSEFDFGEKKNNTETETMSLEDYLSTSLNVDPTAVEFKSEPRKLTSLPDLKSRSGERGEDNKIEDDLGKKLFAWEKDESGKNKSLPDLLFCLDEVILMGNQ